MKTKNTTSEWENPHELEAKSALRGAACSPSFDTTETDAAWSAHCIDPDSSSGDPWDLAKKLKTELAAAREEIDMMGIRYAAAEMHHANNMQEVTEQRDRLAEALKKAKAVYTPSSKGEYQTGWHDAICWVNQQALRSLNPDHTVVANDMIASVKGGADE